MFIIDKDVLFTRLKDRFKLLNMTMGFVAKLSPLVVPVTNFDDLARVSKVDGVSVNCSASAATCFTVPEGKRWRVKMIRRGGTTGSTYLSLISGSETVGVTVLGTSSEVQWTDFPMQAGDYIQIENSGNGADTAINVAIIAEEEDLY